MVRESLTRIYEEMEQAGYKVGALRIHQLLRDKIPLEDFSEEAILWGADVRVDGSMSQDTVSIMSWGPPSGVHPRLIIAKILPGGRHKVISTFSP